MAIHDHSYKQFFSHPEMVRDLLRDFVPFDWVKELDFSTLEKINHSYITDDLRERADDVVWRVRFNDQWLYVYLLIEFQSTVDRFMAVRLLTYVGLLYQDLIKSKQLPRGKKLPPVLPIVLYNGKKPWKAAMQLSELLPPLPEQLQDFQPTLKYVLIDEQSYTTGELERLENLTAALIRAELAESVEDLLKIVANLLVWLDSDKQSGLRRAFKEFFGRLLSETAHIEIDITAVQDLTEMHRMLNERIREWGRPYREEGLKEGIEQGIELGEARLLKRQLTKRFGPMPEWVVAKIDEATTDQLEIWSEQILDAESVEAVFA